MARHVARCEGASSDATGGRAQWHATVGQSVTYWLKALIGLIEYSYHQGIPSFPEVQLQRTLAGKSSWVHTSEDKIT
jgi:hypothetical protein